MVAKTFPGFLKSIHGFLPFNLTHIPPQKTHACTVIIQSLKCQPVGQVEDMVSSWKTDEDFDVVIKPFLGLHFLLEETHHNQHPREIQYATPVYPVASKKQ